MRWRQDRHWFHLNLFLANKKNSFEKHENRNIRRKPHVCQIGGDKTRVVIKTKLATSTTRGWSYNKPQNIITKLGPTLHIVHRLTLNRNDLHLTPKWSVNNTTRSHAEHVHRRLFLFYRESRSSRLLILHETQNGNHCGPVWHSSCSSRLDIGKARSNHVVRMNLCLHSGEFESVVIAWQQSVWKVCLSNHMSA